MSQKSNTIEQDLRQLEAIVAWFEQDDLEIEAAIAQFEKGNELATKIKGQLATIENKITVLKERFDETE